MANSNKNNSKLSNSKISSVRENVAPRTSQCNSAGTGARARQGTGSRTKK